MMFRQAIAAIVEYWQAMIGRDSLSDIRESIPHTQILRLHRITIENDRYMLAGMVCSRPDGITAMIGSQDNSIARKQ
jgi:hypothetical protein